jgi:hypothetical protein
LGRHRRPGRDGPGHGKFQDAALLAGERPDLSRWLLQAAYSEVSPTEPSDDPTLTFLEPSSAFSVASYGDKSVRMRAHLSFEAAPPWLDIADNLNMWAFFVELTVGTADLEVAADWNRQAAAFPRRPSKERCRLPSPPAKYQPRDPVQPVRVRPPTRRG